MLNKTINFLIIYSISAVWIVNGLYCKVLNFVPRHDQIVSRILDISISRPITISIGILEIIMGLWVLSRLKSNLNAIVQIVIVLVMNVLEFLLVPDLLLWGKLNICFAIVFITIVYFANFKLNKTYVTKS